MHELATTQHLLQLVIQQAQQANATRINTVYLVIGQLSSMIDDCVQFYWDLLAQDTLAQGSKLHFTRLLATFECPQCNQSFTINESPDFLCPVCRCSGTLIAGNEFRLDAIDIETTEDMEQHT